MGHGRQVKGRKGREKREKVYVVIERFADEETE